MFADVLTFGPSYEDRHRTFRYMYEPLAFGLLKILRHTRDLCQSQRDSEPQTKRFCVSSPCARVSCFCV